MILTRIKYLFSIVFLFGLTQGAMAQERVILTLHGSNTIGAELAPALVERWLETQSYSGIHRSVAADNKTIVRGRKAGGEQVAVVIHAQGSSTGFVNLASAHADIGLSSRRIKPHEVKKLSQLGDMTSYQCEYVLGLDGIAVIVNQSNKVKALDTQSLRKLFTGEVSDWAQLGGRAGPVHVYTRDSHSGTFDTFKSLVLGDNAKLSRKARVFETNEALSEAVMNDKQSIGFVALPEVRRAHAVVLSDGEGLAIAPHSFTVATEDYVLARRLFLYVPENDANPQALAFAEFAVSEAGQRVVDSSGFVSQSILEGKVQARDGISDEYLDLLQNAKRLSLNFRFQSGKVLPDSKAQRDMDRLADYLSRPENQARGITLVGFSDSSEAMPMQSLELSMLRADAIANRLIKKGVEPKHVRGYGQVAPVASNDTVYGRGKNRRVEVWLD